MWLGSKKNHLIVTCAVREYYLRIRLFSEVVEKRFALWEHDEVSFSFVS
jgi:hypothetical protein